MTNAITRIVISAVAILSSASLFSDESEKNDEIFKKLSTEMSLSTETEHVNRGRFNGRQIVHPTFKIGYHLRDSIGAYAGADTLAALKHGYGAWNEVAPYVGGTYKFSDNVTIDTGYRHYFYAGISSKDANGIKRDTNEIYAGILSDILIFGQTINPSVYLSYCFDRKEINVEGKIGYGVDLSNYIFNGVGLDIGAKVGHDASGRPFGKKYNRREHGSKKYFYYGMNADIVYTVNDCVGTRAGIEYDGNAGGKNSWMNNYSGGRKRMILFSTTVECKF